MVEYNKVFRVTMDCPVDDICDTINHLNDDVRATWQENSDDMIEVTIQGYTHSDELTNNYSVDKIEEQIDKLKEFHIPEPGMC